MTTITNAIKPTMLISSPIPTPSIQFAARLPTTFLPIRTKPLSSSSKPLSVTVKCSNNLNLPNESSDLEDELLVERMAAAVEQIYSNEREKVRELVAWGKPKFKKAMLQGGQLRKLTLPKVPETRKFLEYVIIDAAKKARRNLLATLEMEDADLKKFEGKLSPEKKKLHERRRRTALALVWFSDWD